jgi:hypothetical protein
LPSIGPRDRLPTATATTRHHSARCARRQGLRFQIKPRGCAPTRNMPGNPVSIHHQGHSRFLSKGSLQRSRPYRTSGRQAQTVQAHRVTLRKDRAELWLVCCARAQLHLDQIRPHSLGLVTSVVRTRPPQGYLGDASSAGRHRFFVRRITRTAGSCRPAPKRRLPYR